MDWKAEVRKHEQAVENLSMEDCWRYFKWEWLRRNPFYCGFSKKGYQHTTKKGSVRNVTDYEFEGMFPKATRQLQALDKSKKAPQQKKGLRKLLLSEFEASCGLKSPVDPVTGNWKDCTWGKTEVSKLFDDIDGFSGFNIAQRKNEKQRVLNEVLEKGTRLPQFPRAVDVEYHRYEQPAKDQDGTVISSSLTNNGYVGFTKHRIIANRCAEGLIIFDIKKTVKKCTYRNVALALGFNVIDSGTSDPVTSKIMSQFLVTAKRVRQAVDPRGIENWK